jgi:hypothetical protein
MYSTLSLQNYKCVALCSQFWEYDNFETTFWPLGLNESKEQWSEVQDEFSKDLI